MRQLFKKVMVCFLAIQLAFFSPIAQAAGWSFGGFNFGNGSLNITQNGVKITTAAVSTAPITSNLGSKILSGAIRGASVLSALSIISGLAEDAIDWVLDPANNRIKYKPKAGANTGSYVSRDYPSVTGTSLQSVCNAIKAYVDSSSRTYIIDWSASSESADSFMCRMHLGDPSNSWGFSGTIKKDTAERTVSIPTVANKIYDIAKSGNTSAQADVTSAVTNLVNAGTYDTPINQAIQDAINNGTLPKDTTDTPTDPTNPTKPEIDTSSITAAIQSLASAFAKSLADNFNAITSVINTSIDKLLNKQDQIQGEVVNVGSKVEGVGGQVVGVGDKVDNVGGKVVGVGDAVKDVGGKVVGLNDSVDKVGDKVVGVGDKVDAVGDKVGTKVDAVGDKVGTKVDAVGDKVVGVGDKVDAVGDKVTAVGDKVGEKVDASTAANEKIAQKVDDLTKKVDTVGEKVEAAGDKVTDAIKEKKEEENQDTKCPPMTIKVGDKCIDIPFPDVDEKMTCSYSDFTQKVCDFTDWAKSPFDEPNEDGKVDIDENPDLPTINTDKVKFQNQCPTPTPLDISISSLMVNFHDELNYQPLCDFMTKLRPFVVGFGYVSGAFIVVGVGRKNG